MSENKEYQIATDVAKGMDYSAVTVVSVERGFVCDECHDPLTQVRISPTVYWAICDKCGKYQMTRKFVNMKVTEIAEKSEYMPCIGIDTFSDGTKA